MCSPRACLIALLALASLAVAPPVTATGAGAGPGDRGHTEARRAETATLIGFTDTPLHVARGAGAAAPTSQVVRVPVSWADVPQGGWADIDWAVEAARASGQLTMLSPYGVRPPDLGQWASFLRELHARYPDVWAIQAWNEPNLPSIGGGLTVAQTAAIVRTAREALPGVRLVGPGVSPSVPGSRRYQARLYRALPDSIGVGLNVYTYENETGVADVVAAFRKARAHGGKAPIYVTELGFHAAYFANQGMASARAFKALRREGAAAVFFYRLLPDASTPHAWEQTGRFNVLNADLSPTPTLNALRSVARRAKP